MSDDQTSRAGLPASCLALMDGKQLDDKVGHTFLLLVADAEGWPHVAMLSVGEVYAPGPDRVFIALHGNSRTSRALRRSSQALVLTVVGQEAHKIRLTFDVAAEPTPEDSLRYFAGTVVDASVDDVGYATVVDGIRYKLNRPESVLPRWEATVKELQRLGNMVN